MDVFLRRLFFVLFPCLLLSTWFIYHAVPLKDGDVWWQMLYGEYFLAHHTLVADHTLFSWSPVDGSDIYCAWIAEIILFLLHEAGGVTLLLVFRNFCMLLPLVFLWRFAVKNAVAGQPLFWFITLLTLLASPGAAFAKPEIFSYVLMTCMAWNWWHIRSCGEKAWANNYLFPLILLVWINSHGSVIFGIFFLALIGAGEFLNGICQRTPLPRRVRYHFFLSLLLCVISLFITPYGHHYLLWLVHKVTPTAQNIDYVDTNMAYTRTFESSALHGHLREYGWIISFIILGIALPGRRKVEFSFLLTNIAFAFLFTRFLRTTFFWPSVFSFSIIFLLPEATSRYSAFFQKKLLILLICTAFLFFSGRTMREAICKPSPRSWPGFGISESHPLDAAGFIEQHFTDPRIGNTFMQGSYLLWKLRPEQGVFFDSRQFPFRSWFMELMQAQKGENINLLVKKYSSADLWCIDLRWQQMLIWFVASSKWRLAFYGRNSAVFVKNELWKEKEMIVSPMTAQFRSLTSGSYLFRFSLLIGDWETAALVSERLASFKSCQVGAAGAGGADSVLQAHIAYSRRGFAKAVDLLKKHPEYIQIPGAAEVFAYSLLHIAANAFYSGDIEAAWRLTNVAREAYPNDPHTVYNTGLIAWALDKTRQKEGANAVKLQDSSTLDAAREWKKYLQAFARNREEYQSASTSRWFDTAEALLAGETRKAVLMLPGPLVIRKRVP